MKAKDWKDNRQKLYYEMIAFLAELISWRKYKGDITFLTDHEYEKIIDILRRVKEVQ